MLGTAPFNVAKDETPRTIDFNQNIRPILAENCFRCHGPDEHQRKAKLRLDTRDGALAKRKEGAAIVPGDLSASLLVQRIESTDDDERMPPIDSGRKLTTKQRELLRRWVKEGAQYEQHWAWTAPKRQALPDIRQKNWPRNPVDYFILARLEKEGLAPSQEANKATLLRRVTLDLTGLPPTPEELEVFLADTSPQAYEKVVDRLLQSPRFGERMAMHWLDLARYADTKRVMAAVKSPEAMGE